MRSRSSTESFDRAGVIPLRLPPILLLLAAGFLAPRRDYLREVRAPVLALNGGKDVLVSADENAPRLRESLRAGGHPASAVHVLPDLNHMFQTAETGMMKEAKDIEETFAPSALQLIGDWITGAAGGRSR